MGFSSNGCESDTELYLYSPHEVPGVNGTLQAGKQYSYADFPGYTGAYGVNFYGEDLAHRALYYRSGWKPALDAANVMSDQYVTSPYIAGGDAGGIPLLYGGGVVGAVAAAVLDQRVSWSDLRGFFKTGASKASMGCDATDTRDGSYYLMFLSLGAVFDPDPVKRATWIAALQNAYTRDFGCKVTSADPLWNNSFANGFLINTTSFPALTATDGSPVLTGTNLPSNICMGTSRGTLTVTNGSADVTGTDFSAASPATGKKLVITGTKGGASYTVFVQYAYNSSTSLTISGLWAGDSGTATYIVENNGAAVTTIGTGNSDPRMRNWGCIRDSATQITLDRPWIKSGGGSETVYLYQYGLAGEGSNRTWSDQVHADAYRLIGGGCGSGQ